MSKMYVDRLSLTPLQEKRFMDKVRFPPHLRKPFDIWLSEVDKVDSSTLDMLFFPIEFVTDCSKRKWFIRYYEVNPTHSNPNTRYWVDDIYSMDTMKPIVHKQRTNILKLVQQHL